MAIEFRCGPCGRLLRTGDDTAGKQAQCPECGALTRVPASAQPPASWAPPLAPLEATASWPPGGAPGSPFAPGPPTPGVQDSQNPYESPSGFNTKAEVLYGGQSGRDTMAIASLVLGLLGFPMICCCSVLSLPVGATAAVLGAVSLQSKNRQMAIAGMALGALQVVLCIALTAFYIYLAATGELK